MATYIKIIKGSYQGLRGFVKNSNREKSQVFLYKNCEGFDVGISNENIYIIEPAAVLTQLKQAK